MVFCYLMSQIVKYIYYTIHTSSSILVPGAHPGSHWARGGVNSLSDTFKSLTVLYDDY